MLVKRHNDFPALGFLSVFEVMGDLGVLSVDSPGVETIASSGIS